jgi:hypothetical protein
MIIPPVLPLVTFPLQNKASTALASGALFFKFTTLSLKHLKRLYQWWIQLASAIIL